MAENHPIHCPICGLPKYKFCQYTEHLEARHQFLHNFRVKCHVPGCNSYFDKVYNFKKHDQRYHKTLYFIDPVGNQLINRPNHEHANDGSDNDNDANNQMEFNHDEEIEDPLEQQSVEQIVEEFKAHFASFILNIKEKHLLPDILQNTLIAEGNFLVEYTCKML